MAVFTGLGEPLFVNLKCKTAINSLKNLAHFHVLSCQSPHEKMKPNEPPYDKTNNVAVRPAKTQISMGIRPV